MLQYRRVGHQPTHRSLRFHGSRPTSTQNKTVIAEHLAMALRKVEAYGSNSSSQPVSLFLVWICDLPCVLYRNFSLPRFHLSSCLPAIPKSFQRRAHFSSTSPQYLRLRLLLGHLHSSTWFPPLNTLINILVHC